MQSPQTLTANDPKVFISPLLTLENLAALLARTPAGLRASIQSSTEFGTALRGARVKLGRRVYFRRDLIDQLIVQATGQ